MKSRRPASWQFLAVPEGPARSAGRAVALAKAESSSRGPRGHEPRAKQRERRRLGNRSQIGGNRLKIHDESLGRGLIREMKSEELGADKARLGARQISTPPQPGKEVAEHGERNPAVG